MSDHGAMFLAEALGNLRNIQRQADAAMKQLNDEQFLACLDSESNSVAIIVKHMAGNLRSRFTDFLTSDGEKPDRNRDQEFVVEEGASRAEIMAAWQASWQLTLETISALSSEDLAREVTIRNEPHTVMQAILRQIAHHASHAGQIVLLAKHWMGPSWQTLSVPRGQSEAFNTAYAARFKKG